MTNSNIHGISISEAKSGLKSKSFSARDLVQSYLDRIQRFNRKYNIFVSINENALFEADKADINLPLGGIPIAIKDNFLTTGLRATASSRLLSNYYPHYESTVTARLKNAGAIILGKTNMDAWAHGSSTETSDFGPTLNPWNKDFLPGGSSGGSAAAVAADMCLAAIGSETAGSIRQPSAWCGVTGFKPTYGRVSRYGVIAMASSTDSPGPITKNVEDAAFITRIIAGQDPYDATTSPSLVENYMENLSERRRFKVGLPREYVDILDPQMRKIIMQAVDTMKTLGCKIEETSLIHPKYAMGVYTIVQRSEVSSNLARYDGVRFGSDRSCFGEEAKRRIMLGTFTLSSGYYDQYYNKAQKVRSLIIRDFSEAFSKFDLIINPPSPGTALKVGSSKNQSMFGEIQDILVEPSSVAGLPGISIPCGFISGLPVGFGLIGPQFGETKILSAAYAFQQLTNYHLQKPQL